jgi:hypothetical protein
MVKDNKKFWIIGGVIVLLLFMSQGNQGQKEATADNVIFKKTDQATCDSIENFCPLVGLEANQYFKDCVDIGGGQCSCTKVTCPNGCSGGACIGSTPPPTTNECVAGKYYCTHDTPDPNDKGLVAICDSDEQGFTIVGQCSDKTCSIIQPSFGDSIAEVCGETFNPICGDGICSQNENCDIDCGIQTPPSTGSGEEFSFDINKWIPYIIGFVGLLVGVKLLGSTGK